ncbi:MAG: glycosyltransferase family 4 protein [Gammaproteobacteria bacterium]|nr:glycosyltransferase family 4 protein [Gammaproteobacteria bacterium]
MGGAEYQVKCLIQQMLKHGGYDITFITRSYDRSYQPDGYKIIPLAKGSDKKRGLIRLISEYRPLRRILYQLKPDAVYQRDGGRLTGAAAYLSDLVGFKLIWHVASEADVRPFMFKRSRYLISSFVEKKILEYGIKNAHKIIVQTKDQAHLLTQNYQRESYALVPNFHPYPEEKTNKSKPIKVIWLANVKPNKRPEIFLQLAKALSDEENTRFIMIGAAQGSSRWHKKLLNTAKTLNNLDCVGKKTQNEVNNILSTSHILVNTSVFEGFSNTFIQAWMREIPVVSLNVNPDQIFDRQSPSIGFHTKTYENLVEKVRLLIRDQEMRISMGKNAKKYALKTHSLDNTNTLLALFNNSVKNKHDF